MNSTLHVHAYSESIAIIEGSSEAAHRAFAEVQKSHALVNIVYSTIKYTYIRERVNLLI